MKKGNLTKKWNKNIHKIEDIIILVICLIIITICCLILNNLNKKSIERLQNIGYSYEDARKIVILDN